jgi:hypothetical protein
MTYVVMTGHTAAVGPAVGTMEESVEVLYSADKVSFCDRSSLNPSEDLQKGSDACGNRRDRNLGN